ncbi:MAG: DUF6503 family protein, partial [Segetibacter sp.]
NMSKIVSIAALILIAISCRTNKRGDEKAFDIVERCIEEYGGKNYRAMDVSFDFRQFRVHLKHNEGVFLYERTTKDSLNNQLHDVLTNDSFKREVNGKKVELSDKENDKYKEGLNAIAYFVLLPYKLSEPAVNLKYAGEITIENKKYDKITVSFNATGGGKDHQDEFCFWIDQGVNTLDYLAYSNGGPRFRKVTKREKVDGIIFQDYENYEVADSTLATYNYDKAFIAGNVKLLSKIEQQNYRSEKNKR